MTHFQGSKPRRLRRDKASAYLKDQHGVDCATRTLAKLACIGGGPEMIYSGRWPLYPIEKLDEWARARLSPAVRSVSELRAIRQDARAA